jgi:hypothetical protein
LYNIGKYGIVNSVFVNFIINFAIICEGTVKYQPFSNVNIASKKFLNNAEYR